MYDTSQAPYNDDYDPSKGYTQILAMPGRVEQAREFTQAQTIQRDFLGRLGDSIYSNGTVIDGCSLIIRDNQAIISSGRLFLDGLIRMVDGTVITITGVGSEIIGAKIVQELVTESEDASLRDPAQNYDNYGQSGAHRLKETVQFTLNDTESATVFSLMDGVIQNAAGNNEDDNYLNDTLARRTFDENGSYKVRGLVLQNRDESDTDHVFVGISEGKAYVKGYEVTKPTTSRVALDKSVTTREVSNEAKNYTKGLTYKLNNQPPKEFTKVMCLIQYKTTMTRGNTGGGIDYITNSKPGSVDSIVEVKDQRGDTTYQSGVDYQLTNEGVDWSPGGKEPSTGMTYQLTYNYNQDMDIDTEVELSHQNSYLQTMTVQLKRDKKGSENMRDQIMIPSNAVLKTVNTVSQTQAIGGQEKTYEVTTDFTVVDESTGDVESENRENKVYIDWTPGGSEPDDQQDYIVSYTLIVTETDEDNWYVKFIGESTPVEGSRMYFDYKFYLYRKDLICMNKTGDFLVFPGTPDTLLLAEPVINQDETLLVIGTVLIYPNSGKVEVNTYNTTRLDQANLFNLRQRVDNLEYNIAMTDLDKEAMEGENATQLKGVFTDGFLGLTKADITHRDFDCTIDLDNNELTLPMTQEVKQAKPNTGNQESTADGVGNLYMAQFTNVLALQQPYATGTFKVNEYAVYENMALIELTPSADNWIDTEHITVNGGEKTTTTTLRRWWYHRGESWAEDEKNKWLELTGTTGEQLEWANYQGTVETTTSDVVLDEAIMYMRSIPVTVHGSNFLINSDNLYCLFNDIRIPLTGTNGTEAGTTGGTVKANARGEFWATFNVPNNVMCGSVEVKVENANNKSSAVYTAQGRHQIIQDTVFQTYVTVNTTDPIAQAFQQDEDFLLTKLGLYFSTRDADRNIVLQIRDMVNGYPGTTVYDEEVIYADDVVTSSDSSAVTEIELTQPVYCKGGTQYCFTILSDSNEYEMYAATLGGTDILRQIAVTSQPYTAGVMFTSSNAMTWTAHQTSDLKFDLYRAEYSEEGTLIFDSVSLSAVNRIVLAAQSVDYKNVGVKWYYRLNETSTWLPIETYVDRELSTQTNQVQFKVELKTNGSSSPILAAQGVNVIGFCEKRHGVYISRTVVMDEDFNTINVSLEAALPSGTKIDVYYSTDNVQWTKMDADPKPTVVDIDFNRYTYKKDSLPPGTNTYKIKIELDTDNQMVRPRVRKLISILKNV